MTSVGMPEPREFRHDIHLLRLSVERFGTHTPSGPRLHLLRSILGRLISIRYPDGHIGKTGIRVIAAMLDYRPNRQSFMLFRRALVALDDSLRNPAVKAASGRELRGLHRILSGSRFQQGTPYDFWRAIGAPFRDLSRWFSHRLTVSPAPFTIVGVSIVLMSIGVALVIARRSMAGRLTSASLSMPETGEMSSGQARRRAQELSSMGEYRDALRYLLASVLMGLREDHVVESWAGLTNRELVNAVRTGLSATSEGVSPNQADVRPLEELISHFDEVWYGDGAIGPDAYAVCERLASSAAAMVGNSQAA